MENLAIIRNVMRHAAVEFEGREREALASALSHTQTYAAGTTVVRQDETVAISTLLVQGFMTRHVDAADGRRHLVAVHVPGDFVDLHAFVLKRLDHEVGALTDVTVAVFPHASLEQVQRADPLLTHRLWFMTMLDAAKHRQWIFRLASLTAVQRVAHFLCEMNARLLAIGASDGASFELPMTQASIGEVCGLTNVHVNRVLRQLRELGLCTMRAAQVDILDIQGLAAVGVFQPDYLYLDEPTAARASGQPRTAHD